MLAAHERKAATVPKFIDFTRAEEGTMNQATVLRVRSEAVDSIELVPET